MYKSALIISLQKFGNNCEMIIAWLSFHNRLSVVFLRLHYTLQLRYQIRVYFVQFQGELKKLSHDQLLHLSTSFFNTRPSLLHDLLLWLQEPTESFQQILHPVPKWCKCTLCQEMLNQKERKCCGRKTCVTKDQAFFEVCLKWNKFRSGNKIKGRYICFSTNIREQINATYCIPPVCDVATWSSWGRQQSCHTFLCFLENTQGLTICKWAIHWLQRSLISQRPAMNWFITLNTLCITKHIFINSLPANQAITSVTNKI